VVRDRGQAAPAGAKPAGARIEAGAVVAGNLQFTRRLGRGGMGEVWLARQTQWDADVAVKIPTAEILADAAHRHRIVREAEAWTELGLHPHIAYCHYAQPLDDLLLLVVEYVDGGNLREWIADGRCAGLRTGLNLAIQFCHGLERAHALGLVHRDIKPENVLMSRDGTLKITDFGIVRKALGVVEAAGVGPRSTAAGMTMVAIGTEDHMAPEQWGDRQPAGVVDPGDVLARVSPAWSWGADVRVTNRILLGIKLIHANDVHNDDPRANTPYFRPVVTAMSSDVTGRRSSTLTQPRNYRTPRRSRSTLLSCSDDGRPETAPILPIICTRAATAGLPGRLAYRLGAVSRRAPCQ
jgi:serine/threonine protein kinase